MQPGTFSTWQDNDVLHKEKIENTFKKMSLPFDKTLVCTYAVFRARQLSVLWCFKHQVINSTVLVSPWSHWQMNIYKACNDTWCLDHCPEEPHQPQPRAGNITRLNNSSISAYFYY